MLALCSYQPLLQVSDALHHCSLPGMPMAQALGQALSPILPKQLLMAKNCNALAACSLSRSGCSLHRAILPAAMWF